MIDLPAPWRLVRARHGLLLVDAHDVYVGRAIVEYGEYGEHEQLALQRILSATAGAVVEVGANIGALTVPLARQLALAGRELVAFEPQPVIFHVLCANVALNALANVRAWPFACGARPGTRYFTSPDYAAPGNFGGVAMSADAVPGAVDVPCVRLDDVVARHEVGLIKIDAEGAELDVLAGAETIVSRARPVLYVENDRVDLSQALIEWLWARDYRLWWHVPLLFNPDNFFGNTVNHYPRIGSFNMLGLPRERHLPVTELEEITDAGAHPLRRR